MPGNDIGALTRFQPANEAALDHGVRSAYRWTTLLPVRCDWRSRWLTEKGYSETDRALRLVAPD